MQIVHSILVNKDSIIISIYEENCQVKFAEY